MTAPVNNNCLCASFTTTAVCTDHDRRKNRLQLCNIESRNIDLTSCKAA